MLLLRRSHTHPQYALGPDLPGGIIEDGEDFAHGACREALEETGLTIEPTAVKLIYSFEQTYFGKPISRFIYAVRLTDVQPSISISWEHDKSSWVKPRDIKGLEEPYQQGIDYANQHNLWNEV